MKRPSSYTALTHRTLGHIAIAGISLPLIALPLSLLNTPSVQAAPTNPGLHASHRQRAQQLLKALNLTPNQQQQLQAIRKTTRAEMDTVLSPTQKNQLRQGLQSGQNLPDVLRSLNLSEDQRTSLRRIMTNTRQQVSATLTPDQRQQVQQKMESLGLPGGQLP